MLDREQIVDLLYYLGASEVKDKPGNKWIQFTCTVHNEVHPSAGVNIESNIYNCFSCGSCGTLDWLCHNSNKDEFPTVESARKFIEKRYNVKLYGRNVELEHYEGLLTYDEVKAKKKLVKKREELPLKTIARFKSGKETYKYFFDRGFTKKTMQDFRIGRDTESKTVTVPIFYDDGKLAGVIGRYISKKRLKNERYKVYEFNKSNVTFPQDKLVVKDDTIILVEGLLDALWLHQLGFCNAQAILGNKISKQQAKFLKSKAHTFIRMFDNDTGGERAKKQYDTIMTECKTYDVTYPEGCKDPQECSKKQIEEMLRNKKTPLSGMFKEWKEVY